MKKKLTKKEKEGYLKTGRANDPLSQVRIYRYISFPLAKLLAKTPITANQVTALGLIASIALLFTLAMGTYPALIASAILIQLATLFDFIDGNVARIKKQSSIFGAWFDPVAHQIGFLTLFFGLAWGINNNPPAYITGIIDSIFNGLNLNFGYLVWILSIISLYAFLSIMQMKGVYVRMRRQQETPNFNLPQGKKVGLKRFILLNKQNMLNFFSIGFLLNQAFLFLFIFTVYSSLYFIALLVIYSKNLKKLDKKKK